MYSFKGIKAVERLSAELLGLVSRVPYPRDARLKGK